MTCLDQVLSVKLKVTSDPSQPLSYYDMATIKRVKGNHIRIPRNTSISFAPILGSSVLQDDRNCFLHTRDGRLFIFKSFKKLSELASTNVKLFECFDNNCYVLIQQVGTSMFLTLHESFEEELGDRFEIDLSFPRDPVTAGGSRVGEKICVEMITVKHDQFLFELLACDLKRESISDVLLLSIDDKLMWIKCTHDSSIETITTAKAVIRGLKHHEEILMMLDELSTLTVFHLCRTTPTIRKTEIVLDGIVKCFRFHQNTFIYSNLERIVVIELDQFAQATKRSIDISGITCLTHVARHDFLLAICHNRLFYYVPMHHSQRRERKKVEDDFEELLSSDIEEIPQVAKFIEAEERNLLEVEERIIKAQKMRFLMQQLSSDQKFSAGEAIIEFHRNYPLDPPRNAIICNASPSYLGFGFIEININFAKVLVAMAINVAFNRHGASGVVTRTIKIDCASESCCIILPAEPADDALGEKSLELTLSHAVKGKTLLMTYPIDIKEVVPLKGRIVKPRDSLDDCLEIVKRIQM